MLVADDGIVPDSADVTAVVDVIVLELESTDVVALAGVFDDLMMMIKFLLVLFSLFSLGAKNQMRFYIKIQNLQIAKAQKFENKTKKCMLFVI